MHPKRRAKYNSLWVRSTRHLQPLYSFYLFPFCTGFMLIQSNRILRSCQQWYYQLSQSTLSKIGGQEWMKFIE